MADEAVVPSEENAVDAGRSESPDEELESLRSILIGPAERQLQALRSRMDDRFAHASEVAAVLPQALLSRAHDPDLARALAPTVERAITASVRKDPQPLADAIFPVIGPAIRKAVAASLAAMVESFNLALEHSVSWRALRWRVEAWRTGNPFGQVVLLHTLLYRVEHVFLIHRKTGLLLQHVRAGPAQVEDAQMMSAMLTAIRDFVQDSFRVSEQDSLDSLQVGELCVLVEQGPLAILAVVTRGNVPQELRRVLQRLLETIHLQYAEALHAFTGDAQAFDSSRPILEECLQAEYRQDKKPRGRALGVVAGLVVIALGVWLTFWMRDYLQWTRYVNALKNEPGMVVIASSRSGGRYVLSGLRDPLARDPTVILKESRVSSDVAATWEPYQSLSPSFVLARARRVLKPPPTTTLTVKDGVLSATGEASAAWITEASRIALLLAGVSAFDNSGVLASGLVATRRRIEAAAVLFVRGLSALFPGQDDVLRSLAADIRELDALASAAGRSYRLEIVGNTDADGLSEKNMGLSRLRAEQLVRVLGLQSTSHVDVRPVGVGSMRPLAAGDTDVEKHRNRRVDIHVIETAAAAVPRSTP